MYISLPWDAVQPVAPSLPDEPSAAPSSTHRLPPFQDPGSPKYNAPAVIFICTLAGVVLLVGLFALLWKRYRHLLARYVPLPKWAYRAINAAQAISFPMHASACLCGWLRVPSPGPSPSNGSLPPPYYEQASASGPPAMPPGLLPPHSGGTSASARFEPTPSPPPAYPPAPPSTPVNEAAATAAAASSVIPSTTPPASDPLAHGSASAASSVPNPPPPAVLAAPGRSWQRSVRSTHVPALPGPPPVYPPPPLPESQRTAERDFGLHAEDVCVTPWGSVEASTPRASSVLARCRYEA